MCGRFVASRPVAEVAAIFDVEDIEVPETLTAPRWNVGPTSGVLAVAARVPLDATLPRRRLTDYRWGLVPPWAKDPGGGARAFNARAETLAERPTFRSALAKRRCLIPADGFYEWDKVAGADRAVTRRPWYFTSTDGSLQALAGLWEAWRPHVDAGPVTVDSGAGWHGDWLLSCTVITTAANEIVAPVHDRMPVIVDRNDWGVWLEPGPADPAEIARVLHGAPARTLRSYQVATTVNSSHADGPGLAVPLSPPS